MKDKLRILKLYLDENLNNKGFVCINSDKGVFNYAREQNNLIQLFGFAYSCYTESIVLDNFGCAVSFKQIEEILTPLLIKNEVVGKSFALPATIRCDTNSSKINSTKVEISSQTNLTELVEQIMTFFTEECREFYIHHLSIEDILPVIEKMDFPSLNTYLGTGAIFKKILIYHLSKHEDTNSLIAEVSTQIEEGVRTNPEETLYRAYKNILISCKDFINLK